jgi:hypothetical protein
MPFIAFLFELMLVIRESRLDINEEVLPQPARQATPRPSSPLVPHGDPDAETWNVYPGNLHQTDDDWRMSPPGM